MQNVSQSCSPTEGYGEALIGALCNSVSECDEKRTQPKFRVTVSIARKENEFRAISVECEIHVFVVSQLPIALTLKLTAVRAQQLIEHIRMR